MAVLAVASTLACARPDDPAAVGRIETGSPRQEARQRPARPRPNAGARAKLEQHLRLGWWNRPQKIELLGLTDEQRTQLDQVFLEQMETEVEDAAFRTELEAFGNALEIGDLEAANRHADKMTEYFSRSQRRQIQAVIDGSAVLTADQLQILAERFPGLLRRPWVHTKSLRERGEEALEGGRGKQVDRDAP